MNYKIYMRGGEEAAKVIKALIDKGFVRNDHIDGYGSAKNCLYGIPRLYPSDEQISIRWDTSDSNAFINAGCNEVSPAQFYKIISGQEWESEVFPKLQKEKIYCMGSKTCKEILAKLLEDDICAFPITYLKYADDPYSVWGYSLAAPNYGKDIGYSKNLEWFSNAGYQLVTSKEFYKIWSGKDWDCKESVKPEKKYIGFRGGEGVCIGLLPMRIKNPLRLPGKNPDVIYYIEGNTLKWVSTKSGILENITVLDWTDFLIRVVQSNITPVLESTPIPPGLCIPQPSILETESSDCNKLTLSKKQTLKIVL